MAVVEIGGRKLGVVSVNVNVNMNVLDEREAFARPPTPMEYGAAAVQDRQARRAMAWTPVEIRCAVRMTKRP
ncbi:MAG: hypothetical protein ACREJ3_12140 [Polyangiaceae bacterium]